ncbi:hypothetical protein HAX54_044246, partial [Datura stramonium]|nr:hypothetical protein [Datura stramonium]
LDFIKSWTIETSCATLGPSRRHYYASRSSLCWTSCTKWACVPCTALQDIGLHALHALRNATIRLKL